MIEFNLLPDVKLAFIKAKRLKGLVTTISVTIGAVALAVFIALFVIVKVVQKSNINHLTNEINVSKSEITGNTNLNKILTIQSQLQALPTIENQLPVASRIFSYMTELVPTSLTISSLAVDFTSNSVSMSGNADSLASVNQFVDTLKFSTYTDQFVKNQTAFTNVLLGSFSFSSSGSSSGGSSASYGISFNFSPNIFSPKNNVSLTVPQITTTRSILDQPTELFKSNSGN